VGWLGGTRPVFLDANRRGGLSALYCRAEERLPRGVGPVSAALGRRREVLSSADFQVPRQPVEFEQFLRPEHVAAFEQISTSRLDPRFASDAPSEFAEFELLHHVDVAPAAGTLVLFDSVSLPHLVREVTAKRQRIAATGWFHEESQMVFT